MKLEIYAKHSGLAAITVKDENGKIVCDRDDYLPEFIGGDDISFDIDPETGTILNWDKDAYLNWKNNGFKDDEEVEEETHELIEKCEKLFTTNETLDWDKYDELLKKDKEKFINMTVEIKSRIIPMYEKINNRLLTEYKGEFVPIYSMCNNTIELPELIILKCVSVCELLFDNGYITTKMDITSNPDVLQVLIAKKDEILARQFLHDKKINSEEYFNISIYKAESSEFRRGY